ncbi:MULTISPECIES: hypothetical protein [unclassified Methylobacterium]|uniref:hypothetical protein n=1 Tax=unclassified Methylobacterium TaxID=2615210 RepID=UPI00226A6599|nr:MULTISPECIES: hypothetical protein [unclassified Methylobacterium]
MFVGFSLEDDSGSDSSAYAEDERPIGALTWSGMVDDERLVWHACACSLKASARQPKPAIT